MKKPIASAFPPHRPYCREATLRSVPMVVLTLAQGLVAFTDSALLITVIALLKADPGGQSLIPLAQQLFVLPFLLLAPFVGPIADAIPKGRALFLAVALKFCGALLIATGAGSWLGFALVGIGSASYSPAKYGMLPQLFSPSRLVKANALIEGTTVFMAIAGVVIGGYAADHSTTSALGAWVVCYLASSLLTLALPRLPAESPLRRISIQSMAAEFVGSLGSLYGLRESRFSLMGTSLLIATGTTLRLLIFAWAPVALVVSDNRTPALLVGAASLGMIAGAVLAARSFTVDRAAHAVLPGFFIGPLVAAFSGLAQLPAALGVATLIGICGGAFLIPLNALLQNQGFRTVGAGRALAVQNFSENLTTVIFIGVYGAAVQAGLPLSQTAVALGILIFLGVGLVTLNRPQQNVQPRTRT